jgi:hypothetical protein
MKNKKTNPKVIPMSFSKEDILLEKTLSELERKYNGKNGLPKFNRKKVLKFCLDKGIIDLELGYKILAQLGPNYKEPKKSRKQIIKELENQLYDLYEQIDMIESELHELSR